MKMMMTSKHDCGETLKTELKALRQKYGGPAVDFMNTVCRMEDGSPRSFTDVFDLDNPDTDELASLYTGRDCVRHGYGFVESAAGKRTSEPDPSIFLWTINKLYQSHQGTDSFRKHGFVIHHATLAWTKILVSNLSQDIIRTVKIDFQPFFYHFADPAAMEYWRSQTEVIFRIHLNPALSRVYHMYPFLAKLLRENRVSSLTLQSKHSTPFSLSPFGEHILPALKEIKCKIIDPKLKKVEIELEIQEPAEVASLRDIFESLAGSQSISSMNLCILAPRGPLEYLIEEVLSHPQCRINQLEFMWRPFGWIGPREATPQDMDDILRIVEKCPHIQDVWPLEECSFSKDIPLATMVSVCVVTAQNKAGRGLLQPSIFQKLPSHGIFAPALAAAASNKPSFLPLFRYDGIFYMLKELAVLGIFDNNTERLGCVETSCDTEVLTPRCKIPRFH